ncbi:MAG: tyrosine-type recombinase/integrase [Planktomarina sp.]
MIKTHENNERLKHTYQTRMRHSGGKDQKTVDKVMSALRQFEESTNCKPFKKFKIDQALAFKDWLDTAKNKRTGKPLSLSTKNAQLRSVRDFFCWLVDQPGYRSCIPRDGWQYFRPSRKDQRAAQRAAPRKIPSVEQVARAFDAMPCVTSHQKRDKALIAFLMLTGARIGAVATIRLKHIDLDAQDVFQDAREVNTKHAKTIRTAFFPMGQEYIDALAGYISHLQLDLFFGPEDPLFPKSEIKHGPNGFECKGLDRAPFASSGPLTAIVKEAFASVQLPEYTPHAFRHMLALYGSKHCQTIEHFKAWSENLGHEEMKTTMNSYMPISPERQRELILGMALSSKE